jgi:3D (Asp-Asp-Asp) domain-containing protein
MTYLRARWYDSYLNQFVSPDAIVPDYRNPQSVNRYAYVLGNPFRYIDPSGEFPRPPGVCDRPATNPRGAPEWVIAPSFTDWDWQSNTSFKIDWDWPPVVEYQILAPLWAYCGDFCITGYLFVEETSDYDIGFQVDVTSVESSETVAANRFFMADVLMNGTGKPNSMICQGDDGYISSCNCRQPAGIPDCYSVTDDCTGHCGKGKEFEADIDAYRAVAAHEEVFRQETDEIFIPELRYSPEANSWGNDEFRVRDTGGAIGREHIDVFVGQGPGICGVGYENLANQYVSNQSDRNGVSTTGPGGCDGADGLGPVAVYEKTLLLYTGPCGDWSW